MESLLAAMPAEDTHWRDCLLSSTPAHRVVISKPFYLAVNETTQAEFQAITGRNPAWYSTTGPEPYYVEQVKGEDTARHPVEGITWNDAHDFARLLTRSVQGKLADVPHRNEISLATAAVSAGEIETGEQAALSDDKLRALVVQYRLPTDAEWEHACRGGTATPFSFGDKEPTVTGWFGEPNGGRTWEIGRGEANPLGLFGVHSGVWEWVEDQWSVNEYGRQMDWPVHDPHFTSATPLPRVVRGGMWPDRRSRSFDRYAYDSDFQTFFVGFRLAFDIPQAAD
jgi:formylglycine-generating enzyme required for sulfatase activity